MTDGAKDSASVRADGSAIPSGIADVRVHERPTIVTRNGLTRELYRADWGVGAPALMQVLHVSLRPRAISAWHRHARQTDHIHALVGAIKLVIFDGRAGSPSAGQLAVHLLHPARPQLVVIPPGLWHGIQNLEASIDAEFFNGFDRVYDHSDPDEYRLPLDTEQIPYRF